MNSQIILPEIYLRESWQLYHSLYHVSTVFWTRQNMFYSNRVATSVEAGQHSQLYTSFLQAEIL